MEHLHQPGSLLGRDGTGSKASPFHGVDFTTISLPAGKQYVNTGAQSDTSYFQHTDVSRGHVLPNGQQATGGWVSQQQQQQCVQQHPLQQLHQQPATSSMSQPSSMASSAAALTAAAREQLVQAITRQEGISAAAQSTLLQLLSNMSTVEGGQQGLAGGLSNASQMVSQMHPGAPGSPIKSSSAVSTGGQMLPIPDPTTALLHTAADPAAAPASTADEGISTAAAATAFAALSQTRHLPPALEVLAESEQHQQQQQQGASPSSARADKNLSQLQSGKTQVTYQTQVTYRARALAAAVGAVRPGPAGSTLRLAGAICRSSSGSLVDALLTEAARAENGLLTAGMARSDSLPDMLPAEGAAGVASGAVGAALDAAHAAGGMDSVRECLKDMAMLDSLRVSGGRREGGLEKHLLGRGDDQAVSALLGGAIVCCSHWCPLPCTITLVSDMLWVVNCVTLLSFRPGSTVMHPLRILVGSGPKHCSNTGL